MNIRVNANILYTADEVGELIKQDLKKKGIVIDSNIEVNTEYDLVTGEEEDPYEGEEDIKANFHSFYIEIPEGQISKLFTQEEVKKPVKKK